MMLSKHTLQIVVYCIIGCVVFFAVGWMKQMFSGKAVLGGRRDCNGRSYSSLKSDFLRDGYVVFRSCSIDKKVLNEAAEFTSRIQGVRKGDAFHTEQSVMDIAVDKDTLNILEYIHEKSLFPFQTLNFPVGTQQATHSDVIHFDTLPVRGMMTAAWVALEDIHPDSGPLIYYPGTHKMGLWDIDELGIRLHTLSVDVGNFTGEYYSKKLQETIDRMKLKPQYGTLKKGESFLWAASLLHGGSKVKDSRRTRKSQVLFVVCCALLCLHLCCSGII
jgi:ectoine hydroxylase-related dioxygenase (phytanoyl-CoA dioxygenase family)